MRSKEIFLIYSCRGYINDELLLRNLKLKYSYFFIIRGEITFLAEFQEIIFEKEEFAFIANGTPLQKFDTKI